jgi:tRNA A37 threonylcarbamoyladenosine synthetase subunit TsaC/SUA5/YrdC
MASVAGTGTHATILEANQEGIRQAAQNLKEGKIVAFPTETVYGLGANALIEDSVLQIFRVKGRPLTDPLIVHVPTIKVMCRDDCVCMYVCMYVGCI